mgnify:CR=1 FL=1
MIIAGNKIYEKCGYCGRMVQLNKFLFGSLHICALPEQRDMVRDMVRDARWKMEMQQRGGEDKDE